MAHAASAARSLPQSSSQEAMIATDMTGSVFCVAPPERHPFQGGGFECDVCGRPRALHYETGFIPRRSRPGKWTEVVTDDYKAHFRGAPKHTYPIIRPVPGTKFIQSFRDPKVRKAILDAR